MPPLADNQNIRDRLAHSEGARRALHGLPRVAIPLELMNGFMLRRACTAAMALGLLLWSGMLRAQDQPQPQEPSVASPPVSPMSPMQPMSPVQPLSGNLSMPANLSIYPEHSCESCGAGPQVRTRLEIAADSGCCCCDPRCPGRSLQLPLSRIRTCFPGWYVEADALIVTRNNASINQPVVLADDTGDTVLTTHDLDFGWNGGVRLFVGKATSKCGGWEIGYFGIYGGTPTATATDPNNLDIPRRWRSGRRFRQRRPDDAHLELDGQQRGVQRVSPIRLLPGPVGISIFQSRREIQHPFRRFRRRCQRLSDPTSNNLFGGQIGARTYCQWKCFRFGTPGKPASTATMPWSTRSCSTTTTPSFCAMPKGAGGVSFVGDVNAYASVALSKYLAAPRRLLSAVRQQCGAGADQLDFSFNADSGTQVHHSGNLFVHGASSGLEAAW